MSRKQPTTIDLTTAKPTKGAFDPKLLLNPRAALRKQNSSPEKEYNAATALERLHGVQERRSPANKRQKKEGSPKKQMQRTGGGIIGKDLQEASKAQIDIARAHRRDNNLPIDIIDLSDPEDMLDYEEDVTIVPNSTSQQVCFGMLRASVNAFSIPDATSLLPNQWPRIDCEMERGNGNIVHVKRKGVRFGVISSDTAAPLSRLMQLNLCRCEGRVPSRPKFAKDGESLSGVSAVLPFEIIVYGEAKDQERISTILSQKNVFLVQPTAYDQSFVYINPHVRQTFKAATGTQYGTSIFKTAEEIKSEIEGLFNKIQNTATLSEHAQPTGLVTDLLKHQRQALTFCLAHEDAVATADDLSVWRIVTKGGKRTWRNKITPQVLYNEPRPASGGIIADEMGLGKTLSLLALICATKQLAVDFEDKRSRIRSTLIVCPLSVLSNWTEQITTHSKKGFLNVLVHHDKSRTYSISNLRKYDVILTTYATVANEFKHQKIGDREIILPDVEFFRIVLDEAHMIKQSSTQSSQAAVALLGLHRWCLTATPVQNSLNDLAALFAFMKISPFDSRQVWNQYISQPMKSGDSIAVSRLQTLLKLRVLRRTKDQGQDADKLLSLPPRSEEIRLLSLSEEEQNIYNTHLEHYQRRTKGLGKLMSTMNVLQNINQLRQICISVALLPAQDPLVKDEKCEAEEDQAVVEDLSQEEILELIDSEVCAICQSVIEVGEDESLPYYTPKCLHFFCSEHGASLVGNQVKCPAPRCKGTGPLRELTSESTKTSTPAPKSKRRHNKSPPFSTKISALLTDITTIQADLAPANDPTKTVVFSQFTSFLDLIGLALSDMGFRYARLDGSMTRDERTSQLDFFRRNQDVNVILVSTRAGGVGLNLTMANKVFLMDPAWNPATDSQALSRVHRIGQTKPVSYVRYIIEGSIEQSM